MAGCAQHPLAPHIAPPNPFGYMKRSAVCDVSPVKAAPDGSLSVSMKVRSDDGLCSVPVQTAKGAAYASFGVTSAPDHGKVFLYNYDDQTWVTYTPTTAYAGTDSFNATLIPGAGDSRVKLRVDATMDAIGVVVPRAVVPAVTAPTASKSATKTTTHRRTATKTKH
ncbi:hypothetical protein KGY14_14780 [Ameyamaea chiangmaiensis]|uniref:Uncharacterized protein n=2 Tax=Ameyamaea chiangmaiensis TaxID=442969 RepID=A0A850PGI3_9PROT|nr:hypothetical protein [Ameyamaea chiangmaiensis]MBS4076453.1 hypothetical protein [Ameyamaea chiangmaiensis]NVN41336.1 hypothetical protein [Ameyamaea chiangmaiensis]